MMFLKGIILAIILGSFFCMGSVGYAQEGLGGVRSNGNFREQVNAGMIPFASDFAIEGMLSEHHFPVTKERCAKAFCVHTSLGHGVHHATNTRSAYLFIEPISGIDPEQFSRKAQNISLVIDVSGSMSGWKIAGVIEAAHALVDGLNEQDRLSIVLFNSEAKVVMPSTKVSNKPQIHQLIDSIVAGGSTNIEQGLQKGFEQIDLFLSQKKGNRLVIMTDERPNVGNTSKSGFLKLVGSYADKGVGLSILGIGLDLGTDLAFSVSQLKGGNYYYIENSKQIRTLFSEGLASFLTPVAYELKIDIQISDGLKVADVFGVPLKNAQKNLNGHVTIRASTVFFDKKRTGVVVRFEPDKKYPDSALDATAEVAWSYILEKTGQKENGHATVVHLANQAGTMAEFDNEDLYRGYALVNYAQMLNTALSLWHQGYALEAEAKLRHGRHVLNLDAWIANDMALNNERATADKILSEMTRSRGFAMQQGSWAAEEKNTGRTIGNVTGNGHCVDTQQAALSTCNANQVELPRDERHYK